jgi:hypothetical protein
VEVAEVPIVEFALDCSSVVPLLSTTWSKKNSHGFSFRTYAGFKRLM